MFYASNTIHQAVSDVTTSPKMSHAKIHRYTITIDAHN